MALDLTQIFSEDILRDIVSNYHDENIPLLTQIEPLANSYLRYIYLEQMAGLPSYKKIFTEMPLADDLVLSFPPKGNYPTDDYTINEILTIDTPVTQWLKHLLKVAIFNPKSFNRFGQTVLEVASEHGLTDIAVIALDVVANDPALTYQDVHINQSLLIACSKKKIKIVELLLATGQADVNFQDEYGSTP